MVYRRERPGKRKDIKQWLKNHHWSLRDLKEHVKMNSHHFRRSFKTQLKKMLEEKQLQVFVNELEYESFKGSQFPIVYCVEERGQWVFFCPFCQRKHRHSSMPGHRHSHWHNPDSPLGKGYILKLKNEEVMSYQ